jgi:hypothetical protein
VISEYLIFCVEDIISIEKQALFREEGKSKEFKKLSDIMK